MNRFFRSSAACFLLLMAFCLPAGSAVAQDKACAVLLLHGKWGNPQYMTFFGRRLAPDCAHESLEMPWSRRRAYDKPYPVALQEVAAKVKAMRDKGHARVLLAGHSFGANGALAYMAEVGDVDGVIALAPGHSPAGMYSRGIGRETVDRARELVAAGQGGETLTMEDLNVAQRRHVRMPAEVLLSYFDPAGLGHMPLSAERFRRPVPLLWVQGSADPLTPLLGTEPFDKAPAHPASKAIVVQGDHLTMVEASVPDVLAWIRTLP